MKVLFIVTGSIAIKKCILIFEELTKKKIIIDCIVTKNAMKMESLKSLNKAITGKIYSDNSEKNNKMLHIELTRSADLIVICPATANIIAKYANGYANDLASTSLIASNKQTLIIPAMNSEMWNNTTNQKNVEKLKKNGVEFVGPEYGKLACGEVGMGRLTNIKQIQNIVMEYLYKSKIFKNKKFLITAGPTIEPIDPIRYISNYSSGKQGYEIAKQIILNGGNVTIISGPTQIQAPHKAKLINIKTAKEMLDAVKKNCKVDIAIFAAAVSDLSPKKNNKKIKKENLNNIKLKKNTDILYRIANLKKNRPKIVIGFAAETENHIKNAKQKLNYKNCDAIIVNKINKYNKVFNEENNKVSIVTKNSVFNLKKMTKINIAKKIVNFIHEVENKKL